MCFMVISRLGRGWVARIFPAGGVGGQNGYGLPAGEAGVWILPALGEGEVA